MKIIQQPNGVPLNEAATLILNHSIVTPTGVCLGVLRVEVHTLKRRLSLSTYMFSSSFLLFWCLTAGTASPLEPSPPRVHLHLICTFKSHYGGCFKYVERCTNICRTKTLNWLMTLRRASFTLYPCCVKASLTAVVHVSACWGRSSPLVGTHFLGLSFVKRASC